MSAGIGVDRSAEPGEYLKENEPVDWDWSRTSIDRDRRSCGVAGSGLRRTNTLINNALIHTPMASEPTLGDEAFPTIAKEDKVETFAGERKRPSKIS